MKIVRCLGVAGEVWVATKGYEYRHIDTGGGVFHSKGTWGCAARKGILFRTSSLAKGVLFSNFS